MIFFCFCYTLIFSQNVVKFKTKIEYLTFLEKKFNIEKKNVYLFESENDSTYFGKYSSVIFLKGNNIATIEDIRDIDKNICSPKKFFTNLTVEKIEQAFTNDKKLNSIFFKNLFDNSILYNNDKDIIAIFLFTHQLGNIGLQYYKHKYFIEKLDITCIIMTLDEAEIQDLSNNYSTKVVIKK